MFFNIYRNSFKNWFKKIIWILFLFWSTKLWISTTKYLKQSWKKLLKFQIDQIEFWLKERIVQDNQDMWIHLKSKYNEWLSIG